MKIVNFQGGLGNQMFIYAFSQYLSRQYPRQKIYGAYWSGSLHQHTSFQLDRIFDISLPPHHFITDCISKFARLLERTHIVSDKETERSVFYNGYWLDKKYWKDVDLRELFLFRKPTLSVEAEEYLNKIKSCNAVSVHIRRGDYLSRDNLHKFGIFCTEHYYQLAIERITQEQPDTCFFVFSDDILWVQKNMCIPNAHFVDCHHGDDSWKDLFLMSCCRHNIIANSTFSFWAAMLNPNPNKIVFYPQRWFYWETPDIFPDSWISINTEEVERKYL